MSARKFTVKKVVTKVTKTVVKQAEKFSDEWKAQKIEARKKLDNV